jgi:hypothetical protein
MPSLTQQDLTPFQTIRVHLQNEAAVKAFAELVGQRITSRTRYIRFPKDEPVSVAGMHWVTNDPEHKPVPDDAGFLRESIDAGAAT